MGTFKCSNGVSHRRMLVNSKHVCNTCQLGDTKLSSLFYPGLAHHIKRIKALWQNEVKSSIAQIHFT